MEAFRRSLFVVGKSRRENFHAENVRSIRRRIGDASTYLKEVLGQRQVAIYNGGHR